MTDPSNLRIVTLIPSATEIVAALGLGDSIVGRSHECDWPAGVDQLPALTRARLNPTAPSAEIHENVEALLQAVLGIYDLDTVRLAELAPTHIVTQTQCDVCAVGLDQVEAAVATHFGRRTDVLALAATCLADVIGDIRNLAGRFGTGVGIADELNARITAIAGISQSIPVEERPRVACIEWTDPLMVAGNWVPEIVELAGGLDLFGMPGAHAPRIKPETLFATDPAVLIFMPCGFDLARTTREAAQLIDDPRWQALSAVKSGAVYVTDGNSYFNRPGPRLVESIEILAEIFHPRHFAFGHEGTGWRPLST